MSEMNGESGRSDIAQLTFDGNLRDYDSLVYLLHGKKLNSIVVYSNNATTIVTECGQQVKICGYDKLSVYPLFNAEDVDYSKGWIIENVDSIRSVFFSIDDDADELKLRLRTHCDSEYKLIYTYPKQF